MYLRKNKPEDFAEIKSWFNDKSNNLNKYVSQYKDIDKIAGLQSANRHIWVAEDNGELIGLFDAEISGYSASIAFFINPQMQRRGYGAKMLEVALRMPELVNVKQIWGGVEDGNIASQKLLESFGFKPQVGKDAGMHDFTLIRERLTQ